MGHNKPHSPLEAVLQNAASRPIWTKPSGWLLAAALAGGAVFAKAYLTRKGEQAAGPDQDLYD